jgi:hypothetical protein
MRLMGSLVGRRRSCRKKQMALKDWKRGAKGDDTAREEEGTGRRGRKKEGEAEGREDYYLFDLTHPKLSTPLHHSPTQPPPLTHPPPNKPPPAITTSSHPIPPTYTTKPSTSPNPLLATRSMGLTESLSSHRHA